MDKKKVGEFLASKRGQLGLSCENMAQRIGCHRTTIERTERGESSIRRANIAAVASAYEIEIGELAHLCGYPIESLLAEKHTTQVVTATIEDLKFLVMVAGELKQPLTLSAIIELLKCRQPKDPPEVG